MLHATVAVGVVVLGAEMYGGSCHLVRGYEEQAPTLTVGQRHPAHVLLRTVFLWQDVLFVLLGDGALVNARQTGFLAVAIAVPGTASEPG